MAKYIERETLIDFVKNNTPSFGDSTTMQCVERAILEAPTVDVVEVVRCKDCKYFNIKPHFKQCSHELNMLMNVPLQVSEDHFCSCGEREGGEWE